MRRKQRTVMHHSRTNVRRDVADCDWPQFLESEGEPAKWATYGGPEPTCWPFLLNKKGSETPCQKGQNIT
jgi:hypothetical protein